MLATLQLVASSSQPGQPRRVAITTFWDGSLAYECALPLWCQSAARLSAVLPEAIAPEVVLIAPRPSAECPAAKRRVWDPETAAASRQYVQRMSKSRRATRAGGANMESFLKDAVREDSNFARKIERTSLVCAPYSTNLTAFPPPSLSGRRPPTSALTEAGGKPRSAVLVELHVEACRRDRAVRDGLARTN